MSSEEDGTREESLGNMVDSNTSSKNPEVPLSGGNWFKNKQSMLEMYAADGGFAVAWDIEENEGNKWYGLYSDAQAFYNNPQLNPVDKRCGYEVIPTNTTCRLYARVEWIGIPDTEHQKVRWICNKMNKHSLDNFQRNPELSVYCSSIDNNDGTSKNCLMIVSSVFLFHRNHDGEMKRFVTELCEDEGFFYQDSNGENKCFVDLGIYEQHQCILLPHCCKMGSKVHFERFSGDSSDMEDDELTFNDEIEDSESWQPFILTNPSINGDVIRIPEPLSSEIHTASSESSSERVARIGEKRKLEQIGGSTICDADEDDIVSSLQGDLEDLEVEKSPDDILIEKTLEIDVNKALYLLSRRKKDFTHQEMAMLSVIFKRQRDGNKVSEVYTLIQLAAAVFIV